MPEQQSITYTPYRLQSKPGVRRDGTILDSDNYSDSVWCRFQRGRPKKMGGYRAITSEATGPIRGLEVTSKQTQNIIHSFSPTNVEALLVDQNGLGAGIYDRTPVGFVPQEDYLWQYDDFFDLAGSGKTIIVAHPGRNLINIDNNIPTPVYYGDVEATTPLIPLGQSVDGGVLAIPPYLVLYGSDGLVMNSALNDPTNFSSGDANIANVSPTKIVRGLAVRGAGQSPGAVLWSLDSVIRMSFIGPPQIFRFDTISDQSSILSSNSVIEYDGKYFWTGVDRFLVYDGSVQEVPNNMSINWFYDNLNYAQRQKVWATKIPRYGEIWWFYPRGTATECTDAVIYNIRENTWYDANIARSEGYFAQVFRYPIFADANPEDSGKYTLWQHEFGRDRVIGNVAVAIPSSFTTHDIGAPTGGIVSEAAQGDDRWLRIERVEPDFIQTGPMTVEVITREYADSTQVIGAVGTFDPDTEKIDFRVQGRELRVRFTCNSLYGHYEMGSVLIGVRLGDRRQ
jgi:hypothetical protein